MRRNSERSRFLPGANILDSGLNSHQCLKTWKYNSVESELFSYPYGCPLYIFRPASCWDNNNEDAGDASSVSKRRINKFIPRFHSTDTVQNIYLQYSGVHGKQ